MCESRSLVKAFITDIRSFFGFDDGFLAHGGHHDHLDAFLFLHGLGDLLEGIWGHFLERHFEVFTGFAFVIHESEETLVIHIKALVFLALGDDLLHVVGGGAHIFVLLAGEDVQACEGDLRMPMLACLGGGDFHHLARVALQKHDIALLDGSRLDGSGLGGAGISRLIGFNIVVHLFFYYNNTNPPALLTSPTPSPPSLPLSYILPID